VGEPRPDRRGFVGGISWGNIMDMPPAAGQSVDERYWELASKLNAHEVMCEERSKGIFDRLEKIESGIEKINHWGILIGFTLICSMAGILVTLLLK
jgi:hypothetical protein